MIALEAKFHGLAGLDNRIPAQVARRISARNVRIPGTAQSGAVGIFPVYVPAINRTGAFVGDTNRAHKTRAPVVHNHIAAIASRWRAARHGTGRFARGDRTG